MKDFPLNGDAEGSSEENYRHLRVEDIQSIAIE